MKKLYITTSRDDLEIKDVEGLVISFGEKVIKFGDQACVAIGEFVSYQFIESEETKKSE